MSQSEEDNRIQVEKRYRKVSSYSVVNFELNNNWEGNNGKVTCLEQCLWDVHGFRIFIFKLIAEEEAWGMC